MVNKTLNDIKSQGTVYWITGLSGAGKTVIGHGLYERLKTTKPNVVFLDGDSLREVFGNDLGYTLGDRYNSAMRNARLCKLLSEQNIDVVCATISMINRCQKWNRDNISRYIEIYVRASLDVIYKRDSKSLYGDGGKGQLRNVWGVDIEAEEPITPEVIIDNDGDKTPEELVEYLMVKVHGLTEN